MPLPHTIANGQDADATPVQENFQYLDGRILELEDRIGNVDSEAQAALYTLAGNGVVRGYSGELACAISGTQVTVQSGLALANGQKASLDTAGSVNFAGQPAGTLYVTIDENAVLTVQVSESPLRATLCQVTWDGSTLSNLVDKRTFVVDAEELRAARSEPGGTTHPTISAHLAALWAALAKSTGTATVNATQTAIPHGLGKTPEVVLITMTGPGQVWESQAADSTNIYLTADADGRTCRFVVR